MEVAIIDYGMGNLLSVQRAFEKCGADAVIIDSPIELKNAERIVLPGVGAFPDAMNNLIIGGWIDELNKAALIEKKPLLGICLGMQLLATKSYEVKECEGLNFIEGEVIKFQPKHNERIPHVGWNEIEKQTECVIYENISDGTNYYFVHSYHFVPKNKNNIATITNYCGSFVSSVVRDNIIGTQFHPEKSQKAGFKLIKNFMMM